MMEIKSEEYLRVTVVLLFFGLAVLINSIHAESWGRVMFFVIAYILIYWGCNRLHKYLTAPTPEQETS